MYLFETKQVSVIDAYLVNNGYYTILELIEKAGRAFYQHVKEYHKPLIIAGFGNNGADAFMVAKLFKEDGIICDIYPYRKHLMNENCKILSTGLHLIDHIENIEQYDVIIDGVFGAGLNRAIQDDLADIFAFLNQSSLPKYSIDIPSGIDGDGKIYDHYFHCDHVITFMALKKLYLIKEYQHYYHHVILETLDIDEKIFIDNHIAKIIDENYAIKHLKIRYYDDYKNKNGVILHVTGSHDYVGAGIMAAQGSIYTGCGIVKVCSKENVLDIVRSRLPEVVCIHEKEPDLNVQAILIGCGLSQKDEALEKLTYVLKNAKVPVVVDADGINLLSRHLELLDLCQAPLVFTPHLGELKRLIPDMDIDGFVNKYHCIIIQKGPNTLIHHEKYKYINTTGNQAMAIGGSGDTLAGVVVSLIGQGYDLLTACNLAVYFHGKAGDVLAEDNYMVLPSSLAVQIGKEMKKVENLREI